MKQQAKAVILARVSSKTQEDEGYSLDSQLKLLQNYCHRQGFEVVENFKIAETASKEQSRKIFHELLFFISKQKIHHLIIEKTDRFTRNFRDAIAIDDWLEKDENRRLHAVKESLLLHKNASSDVKFMWNIYVSVAKKYSDNLREEAMKGWAEKLAQGWLPAPPPPGYKTVFEYGKKIHVPDAEIASLVARAFELAKLPDYTIARAAEALADMGVTGKSGRPYAKSYVHKMLTNPFYIGTNRFDGKEYPGAQEPIISKELFRQVQDKIHGRRSGRSFKHNPVFKGVICCTDCGFMVTWQKQKGRYYGTCRRQSEECKGTSMLREDRVEAIVVQKLEEIDDQKGEVLAKLKTALQIVQPQNVGEHRRKMISDLHAKLQRMKRMESNLYDDRLAGIVSKEKYQQKCAQLAEQAAEITERLTRLHEAQNMPKPHAKVLSDNPIVDLYLKGEPGQKRIILSVLYKKLGVGSGRVTFDN